MKEDLTFLQADGFDKKISEVSRKGKSPAAYCCCSRPGQRIKPGQVTPPLLV